MTELTHHDAEDGFHEIQLSGKQVVFAFMLTTAAAVFIFLLGVQVGRNAKTTGRTDEPVETTASATSGSTQAPAAQPATPPPAAGAATDPPAPPTETDLSYSKRLQSDKAVPEKLKTNADGDTLPPARPSSSAAAAAPVSVPKETPKETPVTPKETAKTAKETPKAPPPEERPAPAKSAAPSGARPGVWVVQLVALKDRGAAAAVVQRLSAKGYPAFVVSPSPGAPSIYRVQVGRYNDRHEAEQVARRLEKEEQFKPWISH